MPGEDPTAQGRNDYRRFVIAVPINEIVSVRPLYRGVYNPFEGLSSVDDWARMEDELEEFILDEME